MLYAKLQLLSSIWRRSKCLKQTRKTAKTKEVQKTTFQLNFLFYIINGNETIMATDL